MLCDLCKATATEVLSGKINEDAAWKKHPSGYGYERDHKSLEHIAECAVSTSCDLCHMILQAYNFDPCNPNFVGPLRFFGNVSLRVQFDHNYLRRCWFCIKRGTLPDHWITHPDDPVCEFFSITSVGPKPCPRILTIEDLAGLNRLEGNLSHLTKLILVDDLSPESNSQACIAKFREWSISCLSTHSSCSHRKRDRLLPTRVLDVGTFDTLEESRIFETNGQRGTYMTLSHRWGVATKQFQTTKANLNSHRARIPHHTFPTLFRDAITVTRLLGIRFLWIDCLCIIQDDDDDWQRECERMAGIYENSFLTISALLEHSGRGLFQKRLDRVKPVLFRMLDETVVGLRLSTPNLTAAVKASVLNTRGWVLQERVLSPAILHYGDSQIYWECPEGQAEEKRPVIQGHILSLMKNLLHEAQRPGCELYPCGHYIVWYKVIEIYTGKKLTVKTDRLTAILGLAARFARLFGGTFLAGLWAEDLHRGLLWRALRFDTFAGRPGINRKEETDVQSPSWSWVNSEGSVNFEWDMDLKSPSRIHPVARIASNTDAEFIDAYTRCCKNKHRGAMKGSIQMWSVVKRVRCLRRVLQNPGDILDVTSGPVPHPHTDLHTVNILRRRLKILDVELPCFMDVEFEVSMDCYCVIIADWTFVDSWKEFLKRQTDPLDLRCYLVLQRTRKLQRHRNPLDLGEFKRIGVGAASRASVDQFFSSQKKYFLTLV